MDADLFYLIHDMPTYLYIQILGILLLPTSSCVRMYLNPKNFRYQKQVKIHSPLQVV